MAAALCVEATIRRDPDSEKKRLFVCPRTDDRGAMQPARQWKHAVASYGKGPEFVKQQPKPNMNICLTNFFHEQ